MNDNGNGKEEPTRRCPFLNEDCIEKRCVLYMEMARVQSGLRQTFGMCSFSAMTQILSEMNMKAQSPQQTIQMPNILGR